MVSAGDDDEDMAGALIEVPLQELMSQGGVGHPQNVPLVQPFESNVNGFNEQDVSRHLFERILFIAQQQGFVGVTNEMLSSAEQIFLNHGQQLCGQQQILQAVCPVIETQERIFYTDLPRVFGVVKQRILKA